MRAGHRVAGRGRPRTAPASARAGAAGASCPRCSASISAYIEVSPKCAGSARGQRGRPAAAVLGPRRLPQRLLGQAAAAAPVAGDPAERGEAGGAPVRAACPTQLMPAPHTTATPARLGRRPARSSAKVSLRDRRRVAPQPRAVQRRASAAPPRPAGRRWPGRPRRAATGGGRPEPRPRSAASATSARRARRPPRSTPTIGGWKPPPRAVPSTVPSGGDQRDVGLAVARVDGEDASRGSRPRAGAPGCARSAGRSASRRTSILADQRVREQRLEDPVPAAAAARPPAPGPRTP